MREEPEEVLELTESRTLDFTKEAGTKMSFFSSSYDIG